MKDLKDVLLHLITKGECIGVAVSGGCDSMCLLSLLTKYRQELGYSILVLNVEHGIRGEDSIRDSLFVRNYCEKKGLDFLGCSVNVPQYCESEKMTLEQGARELRYNFFDKVLAEKRVDKIATAHHLDDLCETIFMRIMRGSGIAGLTGIKEERQNYIRPLLSVSKKELLDYAQSEGIDFVEDTTNKDTEGYTRNYIREKIMPLIEERFPMYRTSLLRLSTLATEQTEFLDETAIKPHVYPAKKVALLSISDLRNEGTILAKRSIYFALEELSAQIDFEEKHYQSVLSLMEGKNGSGIDLSWNVRCEKEYDSLVFYKKEEKNNEEMPFAIGNFAFGGGRIEIRPYKEGDKIRFALEKIPPNTFIRTRREGDYIKKFGGGTRNLGDYLTDKKIPRRIRENLPLLATGDKVLVVCGVDISEDLKADDNNTLYTIIWY